MKKKPSSTATRSKEQLPIGRAHRSKSARKWMPETIDSPATWRSDSLLRILVSNATSGRNAASARRALDCIVKRLHAGLPLPQEAAEFLADGIEAILRGKTAKQALRLGEKRGTKQMADPYLIYEQCSIRIDQGKEASEAYAEVAKLPAVSVDAAVVKRYYLQVRKAFNVTG